MAGRIEATASGFAVFLDRQDIALVQEMKDRLLPDYLWSEQAWSVGDTVREVQDLRAFADDHGLAWSGEAWERSEAVVARARAIASESAAVEPDDLNLHGLVGRDLRPFQVQGVEFLVQNSRVLVADSMGLGKTWTALAAMEVAEAYPALIVCPTSTTHYWARTAMGGAGEPPLLPGRRFQVLESGKDQVDAEADGWITTWDLVRKHSGVLEEVGFRTFVGDEMHYVRNHDTQRYKSVEALLKAVEPPYRWGLTGTPMMNGPQDLIPQLYLLDRLRDFGGRWSFLDRYCGPRSIWVGGRKKRVHDGSSNLDELHHLLRETGTMIRRRKEDVLKELPSKTRATVPVALSNRRDYDSVYEEFLDAVRQDSDSHLSLLSRLRQMVWKGKYAAMLSWAEDAFQNEDKLVIFTYHRESLRRFLDDLSWTNPVSIHGETPAQDRQDAVDAFQTDPDVRLMVANVIAAAEGLTLTSASHAMFAEMWWNPKKLEQAEDRLHRIGQENPVTAWYLLAEDSIDSDIWGIVERKRKAADLAIDGVVDGESVSREFYRRLREGA